MLLRCSLLFGWALIESVCSTNSFNAALGKKANQSSLYMHHGNPLTADKAVDGNTDPNLQNCASTLEGAAPHWWIVDLGQDYTVTSVIITNRVDLGNRLRDLTVTVTSEDNTETVCGHFPGSAPAVVILTCEQVTWGRYVTITKPDGHRSHILTLCEVQVMAFERSYLLFERRTGKPITSHVTVTMATDFPKCAHTCMKSLTCLGLNYNPDLGQCQLTNSRDSEDTTVGGWEFYVLVS